MVNYSFGGTQVKDVGKWHVFLLCGGSVFGCVFGDILIVIRLNQFGSMYQDKKCI